LPRRIPKKDELIVTAKRTPAKTRDNRVQEPAGTFRNVKKGAGNRRISIARRVAETAP
jgi:hypothetical protein